MNRRNILVVAAVALCATVQSCVSDECLGNRNTLPLAGFYSSGSDPKAISIDSISVAGLDAPGDSILLSSMSAISEVYLPFRIDTESTTFTIKYLQKELLEHDLRDEITFRYEATPKFVSAACGVTYDFKILDIDHTRVLIDSVTCPQGYIDNNPVQNIRIYFRTSDSNSE